MILVTGASGAIGSLVAERLAKRGETLRLFARDPSRVAPIAGAEVVAGAYEDIASLDAAMTGVDVAFVVSLGGEPMKRAALHRQAFEAAKRARVRHVVYLSFAGASPNSLFPYAADHAASEGFLRDTGLDFTCLRDSLYLDSLPDRFDADGVVRGPAGDGRVAWVARADVADVAAAVLAAPEAHRSQTFDVTGPEATTFADVARTLSELTGRALHYEDESLEAAKRWRADLGAPPWEVDVRIGSYLAAGAGELARTSDTVARIAGHPPMSLRAYAVATPASLAPLLKT